MKIKKYKDAEQAFATFLKQESTAQSLDLQADATARLADSYFMQKDLKKAIATYEACENLRQANFDYAIYQQSKCYGYLNNDSKRVETLERLVLLCPKSSYCDDAEYDLATSYHTRNDYATSITAYRNFIAKYPKSPYIRQAYNKLAQSYLNTQILNLYKTFKYVLKLPVSGEAKDALANLEYIYTELEQPANFSNT